MRIPSAPSGFRRRATGRDPVERLLVAMLVLAIAAGPIAPTAFANPEGGNVVAGQAEFGGTPTDVVIQTATDSTIIEWNRFDIGRGESVEFVQPGEFSRVLNRALGVNASQIDGALLSNGQVYIANEAGVFFGGNAVVNVAELVAAGGNLSNEDFLAGIDHFTDLSGGVANAGQIHAGSVTLAGEWVSNQGTVVVDDGALLMLAGDEIWVTQIGSPILIKLQTSGEVPSGPAVENTGTLDAGSGSVRMAAGDALGISIRNSGAIRARQIALEGQDLVQVSGQLDASTGEAGASGGEIQVLGSRVLVDDAVLDVSGPAGGGTILVGGDVHGGGDVQTADFTRVGENAQLKADALDDGDGGKVVVWADTIADVKGAISARGGANGGDGGFAETSGKRSLYVERAPDLTAPNGFGGTWLIDPSNIDIVADAMGSSSVQDLDPAFDDPFFNNPASANYGVLQSSEANAQVTASLIGDALADGQRIVVTTQTLIGNAGEDGNIRVMAPIVVPDSDTLQLGSFELYAANDITLEAAGSITNQNPDLPLSVFLVANDPSQPQNSEADSFKGTVTLGADITTGGGLLSIGGAQIIAERRIDTGGGQLDMVTAGGDIVIRNNTGQPDAVIQTHGGIVGIQGNAGNDPNAPTGETVLVGGNVVIETGASIDSDGGEVSIVSQGGDVTLQAGPGPGIDTNGGELLMDARNQFLFGGDLFIGRTIDTSVKLPGGGIDPDATGGTQIYQTEADLSFTLNAELVTGGGDVLLGNRFQDGEHFLNANITTRGGSFISEGGRQLVIAENVMIDAGDGDPSADKDGNVRLAYLQDIVVGDGVQIRGNTVSLFAGRSIQPGVMDGVGNLEFLEGDRTGPGVPVTGQLIFANDLTLGAGNGYTATGERPVDGVEDPALGEQRTGEVIFGALQIGGIDGDAMNLGSPSSIAILQDADLDASVLGSILPDPSANMDVSYTLQAADGVVTLDDSVTLTTLNSSASDLTLVAKNDFDFGSNPAPGIAVPVVTLRTAEDFTIDAGVAGVLAQVKDITIEAGLGAREMGVGGDVNNETVIDAVSGDLILGAGVTLTSAPGDSTTASSVVLHGGIAGIGDLILESGSRVEADNITLQAGNGMGFGTELSKVDATGGGGTAPAFRRQDGLERPDAFTLHQDAEITDADIPLRTQLSDDGDFLDELNEPLTYTLQSDQGDVTIGVMGGTGETKVDDADLVALAGGTVLLQQAITVPSADIGGRGDFQVSSSLLDNILLDNGPLGGERLVLRAGQSGTGTLTFQTGLSVAADEIRLVAGDGFGGGTSAEVVVQNPNDPSYVAPLFLDTNGNAAPDVFVFQMDASIDDAGFPILPELDQFGPGSSPRIYGVRSDDDSISITSPQSIVSGTQELILSADTINVFAVDQDLVFDLSQSRDGLTDIPLRTEFRGDTIDLRATATPPAAGSTTPPVNARVDGSSLSTNDVLRPTLAGFEADDFGASPGFDLGVIPTTSPQVLRITSQGSIQEVAGHFGLPTPDSFPLGDPLTPRLEGVSYELTSNGGSIEIDDPADVEGSNLSLSIAAEGSQILFPANQTVQLGSLTASAQRELMISADADIVATRALVLVSGSSGEGDLGFEPGVSLSANQIQLVAGNGETVDTDDDGNPLPPPAIDARTGMPTFTFTGEDATFLFLSDADIRQNPTPGVIVNGPSFSVLPDAMQFGFASGTLLDRFLIQSDQGSAVSDYPIGAIDLDDFRLNAFGNPRLLEIDGGVLRLARAAGLDFSTSLSEDNQVALRGLVIDLASDSGTVLADSEWLTLTGNLGELSPRFFSITQNDAITAANLPDIDQFTGGLVFVGVDIASGQQLIRVLRYGLSSTANDILIDTNFAGKVSRDIERAILLLTTRDDRSTLISTDLDLSALTANSPVSFLGPDPRSVTTLGDQLYLQPITLSTADTTLSGATVGIVAPFGSTAPSVVGAGNDLTLIGSRQVIVAGDVGSDSARLGSFEARMSDARATVEFGGVVATDGSQTDPEIANLLYTPVRVYTDGDILLDSVFETDDGASTTARTSIPTTATIFKRFGDLTLDSANGNVMVSQNEKISVGGQLDIATCSVGCAPGTGVVRVGDLSALGIGIATDTLDLMLRAPSDVADVNGNLTRDTGVDLVANDFALQFNQLSFSGAGARPVIGTFNPGSIPVSLVPLPVAAARPSDRAINAGDFGTATVPVDTSPQATTGSSFDLGSSLASRGAIQVLDLRPTGASRAELTEVYTNPIPMPRDPAPSEWLPDTARLGAVGVAVREPTADELETWAKGAAVFNDVTGGANIMGPIVLVATPRLLAGESADALAAYRKVFGPYHHRAPQIKRILGRVLDDYLRETGARRVVGFELRRFIRNRPNSQQEAFRALEDLANLARHHRNLGLVPAEYRQIQRLWLAEITPEGITEEELAEAIYPSRYVRGSDILDLFGR